MVGRSVDLAGCVSIHPAWARTMITRRTRHSEPLLFLLLRLLALGCAAVLFCELGIYYTVLLGCGWPQLKAAAHRGQGWSSPPVLRALFLADTHLLGALKGHWLDKLRRMDWYKLQRFEGVFNFTSAKVVTRKGINFVLVNSIALQGDDCSICRKVENDLQQLSLALNCSRQLDPDNSSENCKEKEIFPASAPILLQHFPLYRTSDEECTGEDSASPEEKKLLFREKYDTLSREASNKLLWWFHPRLILSGHTHSACTVLHGNHLAEISIPSFNWRNRNNPSFLLASITAADFTLAKCFLPRESTVCAIYLTTVAVAINLVLFHFHFWQWMMHYLISKHKSI
uniref:metallophosphoesterase 1 isoform X4 n=1 Tax=Pristiophorus japonicus TaxID=55135 RepID=UPI00398F4231